MTSPSIVIFDSVLANAPSYPELISFLTVTVALSEYTPVPAGLDAFVTVTFVSPAVKQVA